MFYKIKVKDHIRVPPRFFDRSVEEAIVQRIKRKFEGFISEDLGFVIDVSSVDEVKDGVIVPGDGASYYEAVFDLISYRPEMQEVIAGEIKDIADFGAFISMGPTKGMIHISQTMDDFVSFAKDNTLSGKESNRTLKVGDICRARVIAISYKDLANPKLGLTMRQPGLGKLEWLQEDLKKPAKEEPKEKKGKK